MRQEHEGAHPIGVGAKSDTATGSSPAVKARTGLKTIAPSRRRSL